MENRIKFYNTLTRSVETFVPNEDHPAVDRKYAAYTPHRRWRILLAGFYLILLFLGI